jgi:hypothetical protein
VYCRGSRFPETAATSLGVLQPWFLPSSRLVSPKISCHDRIPSLRPTCRTAATSPRPIPRNPRAQVNQAAGDAAIWGGTLSVRRDAQGARNGELSVPHRRGRVCAIDHTLTNEANEPTATACAWCCGSTRNDGSRERNTTCARPSRESVHALDLPVLRVVARRHGGGCERESQSPGRGSVLAL